MATNLVGDEMRQSIRDAIDDVHETFAREIKIFKRKSETFIATTTSTYNALYNRLKSQQRTLGKFTEISAKARIDYITTTEHNRISGTSAQINLSLPDGSVRLKIDSEGYLHIKSASKLEVDDQLYELMSDSGKTGPFEPHYHVLYLRRKD
tara:strand:+ start:209 stop:661 length:453 start_codon:yes stop_codon:yes gene_type:complete